MSAVNCGFVHLHKVVPGPTPCADTVHRPAEATSSRGVAAVGLGHRPPGTRLTQWPTACGKALMASRAVAAHAANGNDKQRTAKPALADSAQGKTTNSVPSACNNRCRRQSRRDLGVGPAPLCQAWVSRSYQMQGACTIATVAWFSFCSFRPPLGRAKSSSDSGCLPGASCPSRAASRQKR